MGQQRTSGLRRVRPNIRGTQFANIDWQLLGYVGNELILSLYGVDFERIYDLEGLTFGGESPISGISPPNPALSWQKNFDSLSVFLTNPILEFQEFGCKTNAPELRGKFGEYLTSKLLIIPQTPIVPVDSGMVSCQLAAGGVAIVLDSPMNEMFMHGEPPFLNSSQATNGTARLVSDTEIFVEFVAPVAVNDVIEWTNNIGFWKNATGGGIATGFVIAV